MALRHLFSLLLLAALWGPSFFFIKIIVRDIPPVTAATLRVAIAAAVLVAVLKLRGTPLPTERAIWGKFTVLGLFGLSLPFVLFSWGELYVDSALAAILNGTTPLFTLLIAHLLIPDDRMTATKAIGTAIGFSGLLLIVAPQFRGGVEASTLGAIAVTLPAACYGFAIVYAKKHLRGFPPLVAPASQLITATLLLTPFALILDRPWNLPFPSPAAAASLAALAILGTAVAFVVYFYLIDNVPATYLSMVTYLVPLVGVGLGVVVLGERIGPAVFAGGALILVGVMVVQGMLRFRWPVIRG